MEEEFTEDSLLQKLSDEIDLENIRLPYIIKDRVLMSPGVWNSYYYDENEIKGAFNKTDWESKEIRSLFLDHEDSRSREWIGEVNNVRINGDDVIADLIIVDKPTAIKLAYGAKMGISPKVHGGTEEGAMRNFVFDNFSVVINPAVKTAWINNSENFDLEKINEYIDIYKSFLEAEEVIEKMSAYTDFVKKFIKANPDLPVAEAMKKAAKEWKKKKGGKKMEEEEISQEEQEEQKEEELAKKKKKPEEEEMQKKKYPYPYKKMEEENEEIKEELADIKIMLEHIAKELAKKKKYPYPEEKMEDDEDSSEEEEMAKKKKPEEEMAKKKKPEEEMAKKKKPEEEEMQKNEDVVEKMSQRIEKLQGEVSKLTEKLNEPNKVSVKQELSESDIDLDMLNVLKAL